MVLGNASSLLVLLLISFTSKSVSDATYQINLSIGRLNKEYCHENTYAIYITNKNYVEPLGSLLRSRTKTTT